MDKIIANRRVILTVAAAALTLMLVSIMVRAFYSDGQLQPSHSWDIFFLSICTICFGAFSLWVFTEGFGPISLERNTLMRWLARLYFIVSFVVALGTFVALVASVFRVITS
jgi:hypothetical protein